MSFFRAVFVATLLFGRALVAEGSEGALVAAEPRFEIGFLNSMLVSQEFTPHFFADADSRVRPIPAHALVIHSEYLWTPVWNLVASFSVPTSEEIARIEGQAPWVYYYPKTMVLGADRPIVELTAPSSRKVELRLGGGIASPLSWRITSLTYPVVSLRARMAVGDAAGIHLGVGYVGNINQGLWMFPFGFGYRI